MVKLKTGALILSFCLANLVHAEQKVFWPSVALLAQESIADQAIPRASLTTSSADAHWLDEMSQRLAAYFPDAEAREEFLSTVRYEALRAGLDPQLVLGIIHVESGFRKYAVSKSGALGFMQVMPFWAQPLGHSRHDLFQLRLNLRYGCNILSHYIALERGNLARALQRYNGSLGQNTYSDWVFYIWRKHWHY